MLAHTFWKIHHVSADPRSPWIAGNVSRQQARILHHTGRFQQKCVGKWSVDTRMSVISVFHHSAGIYICSTGHKEKKIKKSYSGGGGFFLVHTLSLSLILSLSLWRWLKENHTIIITDHYQRRTEGRKERQYAACVDTWSRNVACLDTCKGCSGSERRPSREASASSVYHLELTCSELRAQIKMVCWLLQVTVDFCLGVGGGHFVFILQPEEDRNRGGGTQQKVPSCNQSRHCVFKNGLLIQMSCTQIKLIGHRDKTKVCQGKIQGSCTNVLFIQWARL